jgi:hypothetical protein
VADDDDSVRERLAALEAEVKADASAQRARKEAALAKVREARAAQQAEQQALRDRQVALTTTRKPAPQREPADEPRDDLGGALDLARKAHGVRQELTRAPKAGEKSWIKSGLASMLLGPLGWLYAGSFREAVPASVGWVGVGYLASAILPTFLLMPVLMVALPLSGIAGAVYAVQYNRTGRRQRLFNKEKAEAKKLPPGR